MATNTIIYSDFMTNMNRSPLKKDLSVLENVDAVKKAVRNLVLTNFFERPFQPLLGSNIRAQLFENQTPTLDTEIRKSIEDVILNYEPRAQVVDVKVISNIDYNEIRIIIAFIVLGKAEPTVVDILIDRVR